MSETIPEVETFKAIRAYPFKYQFYDHNDYFALESAVLYLHIPFCIKKCGFCDYTVYTNKTLDVQERYVRYLEREIRNFPTKRVFPKFAVDAVYFGGGTPGVLSGEQLAHLLAVCRETFQVNPDAEITVEFDPPTVTAGKLDTLRTAGFNRVSLGVQCFDDAILAACNRSHDVKIAERAYSLIRDGGFHNVNIDLIFPLPNLAFNTWKHSVDRAVELEPASITTYRLEVWPGTKFNREINAGKLLLPTLDEGHAMHEYAIDALEESGYQRATTTGYYHPGRTSQYSTFLEYYWRTWPMLGFGVSSKSAVHDRLYMNVKSLTRYCELVDQGLIPFDFATYLTKEQEMRRLMIRGLKMCNVSADAFRKRFGIGIDLVFAQQLAELKDKGLIFDIGDDVILTRSGQINWNTVYERFYTDEDRSPAASGEVRYGPSNIMVDLSVA